MGKISTMVAARGLSNGSHDDPQLHSARLLTDAHLQIRTNIT